MNTSERLAIEAECARIINRFVWYADSGDYEKTIALFTPDCQFGYDGGTLYEGHDGLRSLFEMIGTSQHKSVHLTTNILVDVIDENNAESRAFSQIYNGDAPPDADGNLPPLSPFTIMRFDGAFRRTDEGWLASKWRTHFDFRMG